MNLSLKEKDNFLKKLEVKEKSVYENYSFLNLTTEERKHLFEKSLDILLQKKITDINTLVKEIDRYYIYLLKKEVKKRINNDNVNRYLLDFTNNYLSKMTNLEELLISYCNDISYIFPDISFDEWTYLLDNSNLESLIKRLLTSRGKLNLKKVEYLLETSAFPVIDLYCEKNNIIVEEEIQEKTNDSEEIVLTGDAVRDYMYNLPATLSNEEQERLLREISMGHSELKNYIVEHNMRLVASIASKYVSSGISLNDLIQEGSFGLMKAVDYFDISKGYRFSTYASWWIRQVLSRAVAQYGRTIRLPVYFNEEVNKYNRIKNKLANDLKREPTKEEIAASLDVPVEKVEEIIKLSANTISYNIDVSSDDSKEETEMIDLIPDEVDLEKDYLKVDLQKRIRTILESNLNEKERQVILHRFGLIDGIPKTLEEVGSMYNVTRERIRQIEKKGLIKLRNNSDARKLVNYLDYDIDLNKQEEVLLISYFDIGKKHLMKAIDLLDPLEVKYLKSLYGNFYEKKIPIVVDPVHDHIIHKLKVFLRAYAKPENVRITNLSLCIVLGVSKDRLLELIEKLPQTDRNIIYKKYNNNLETSTSKELELPIEYYFTREIVKKLLNIIKEDKVYTKKN